MALTQAVSFTAVEYDSSRCAMAHLKPAELLSVLRIARQRSTRDWCMILMAYRHGLRTSEVCSLRLSDIKDGTLSVQRVKRSLKTVQPLYKHREPLLDEIAALRAWLRERPDDGTEVLFTSRKGGALDRSQFFRIFQSIAAQAGLPPAKRHPRLLKYTLASHMLAGNVDVGLLTQILGHRTMNSTLQYVTTPYAQRAKAARRALALPFLGQA